MELTVTCALVLALVGLVAGNPSAYGIKGGAGAGAVAKAEANAAAFAGSGALPKEISSPTDGTISGSFSKSSASNFASSASSAYSSAFSFSGSGITPGNDANDAPSENTKCKSGACANGTPDHSSSASTSSTAGASSPGRIPCNNGDCQKSPKCQGNCGSGSAPSAPDTDDIAVNTASSAAKISNGYKTENSGSGCLKGKCEITEQENENDVPPKYPNAPAQPTNKPSYLTTPKQDEPCTSPNCKDNIYDNNRPSSYNVPILGPDTSSDTNNPNCATGNCQSQPSKNPSPGVPSNNNTPVLPFVSGSSSCSSPNCAGQSSKTPGESSDKYPHTRPSQPNYNTASASSAVNPISYNAPKTSFPFIPLPSDKKSLPYTGGFGGPPGILKPNDFNVPSKTLSSYTPTASTNTEKPQSPTGPYYPSPCSGGNCGSQPIQVTVQSDTGEKYKPSAPGSYNPSTCASGTCKSYPGQSPLNDYSAPSNGPTSAPGGSHNLPTAPCSAASCGLHSGPSSPQYNPSPSPNPISPGPVGGPSGFQKLNDYSPSSNEPIKNPARPYNPIATPCSSGNCGSQPGQTSPQYNLPPTAPGFGGPAGILKPNDYSGPSKVPASKPAGPYNPTANPCPTGNCGSQPGPSSPSYNPSPIAQVSGFAGPVAVIIPNYNTPSHEPFSKPTVSYKPTVAPCLNGVCVSQPGQSSSLYNPSPSYKPTTPGFGGPVGILKPNDYNAPSNVPTPTPVSYNPSTAPCSTGSCGAQPEQPSSTQYNPSQAYKPSAPAPGFGGPVGVLKPNDYNAPSKLPTSHPPGTYNPSNAPCSTESCGAQPVQPSSPQYNPSSEYKPNAPAPGFGGPVGFLKPNDYNAPSKLPTSYPPGTYNPSTAPCSSGTCGTQPGPPSPQYNPSSEYKPNAPGFGGPAGVLKPNDYNAPSKLPTSHPPGTYNPSTAPCSSGTCGTQPGQASPQYNPSSEYKPNAPGFGGPAGVLKPNDYNAPSKLPTSHPSGTYNPSTAPCSSGTCGTQPVQPSPQYNPSSEYKPNAPGFGGPAGVLKPNDYNAPSKLPTSHPTGSYNPSTVPCSTGSCGSQPSPQYNPSSEYKPNAPGFGGPAGVLKPNDYNAPSKLPTSHPTGSYNPSTAPCSTGSCGSQLGQSSPQYNPSPAYKPTSPGFGGPNGILKPNDYNAPLHVPTSNPPGSYSPITACLSGSCESQPGQSSPQYNPSTINKPNAPGFGGPSGFLKPNAPSNVPDSHPPGSYNPSAPCSTGNCGSQPGQPSPQYNPSTAYKPTPPGFGGPATVIRPNDYNTPSNVPVYPVKAPCSSGICGSQPTQSSPQYKPAPAYQPIAPVPGFGGPSGLLKPNDHSSGPTSNPTGHYNPTKAPCSTGKCGSQPSQPSSQYSPSTAYSSSESTSNPAGPYYPTKAPCSTGDCGSQPSQPSSQYSQSTSYTSLAQSPGFGAPAGVSKPNDYSIPSNVPSSNFKPTEPTASYKPEAAPCSTGGCGPQHSQPVQLRPQYNGPNESGTGIVGPAGISKPNYTSAPSNVPTTYNSAPCSSGNCGHISSGPVTVNSGSASSYQNQPNSCSSGKCGAQPNYNIHNAGAAAHSAAGAIASAKAVAYTGGFGGPPGLLTPFDGKAGPGALAAAFGGQIGGGQDYSRGFNGKSLEGVNASSGSGAQTGAVAGATAGAYNGSQGDQKAKHPGGCSGGCGSGSNGSGAVAGASAKSVATAGAGAYAGSFASSSASAHASAGAATKGGYGK